MAKENKKEKSKGEGRKEIDRSKGAKRVGLGQREWRGARHRKVLVWEDITKNLN